MATISLNPALYTQAQNYAKENIRPPTCAHVLADTLFLPSFSLLFQNFCLTLQAELRQEVVKVIVL